MTVYIACMANDPFEHIVAMEEKAKDLEDRLGIHRNGVTQGICDQRHGLHRSRYYFEKIEIDDVDDSPDLTSIPNGIKKVCRYCGREFWQEKPIRKPREYCMAHWDIHYRQRASYRQKKQKERDLNETNL